MRTYRMFFVPKTEDSFVVRKYGKVVQHSLGPGLRFGGAPGRVNRNAGVSNANRLKRLNHWLAKVGHGPDELNETSSHPSHHHTQLQQLQQLQQQQQRQPSEHNALATTVDTNGTTTNTNTNNDVQMNE